ncbi:MAG: tRNA (adenosine(37)-N6)-threonylcarbamoyltransferase complex ATPase subunit type 1 TsaE [Myxococcota bacterium]|nr:tRNA (adenosine(37)-N6)-threonylcarbamoyltransferase complex ATPase subunit type 1 TsaE [Myxococcota bacterium]
MPWRSRSPDETRALARALAACAAPRAKGGAVVVTLHGALGAGKTVFAKGLAEGLGVPPERVASPTFVIAQELPTPAGPRLVHADWYRVEDAAELEAAGLSDWLAPGTVLVVEWGERYPEALPTDRLEVRLEAEDEHVRRVEARAGGPEAAAVEACWRERCP